MQTAYSILSSLRQRLAVRAREYGLDVQFTGDSPYPDTHWGEGYVGRPGPSFMTVVIPIAGKAPMIAGVRAVDHTAIRTSCDGVEYRFAHKPRPRTEEQRLADAESAIVELFDTHFEWACEHLLDAMRTEAAA